MQTSNHILSLWEADKTPRAISSWKRSLLINQELKADLTRIHADLGINPGRHDGVAKLRCRIRAFAWSSACHVGSPRSQTFSLLAVSNEYNEIVLLSVLSPHNLLSAAGVDWRAQILARFKIDEAGIDLSEPAETPRSHVNRATRYADKLAWSPWLRHNSGDSTALLAHVSAGDLYIRTIHSSPSRDRVSSSDLSPCNLRVGDALLVSMSAPQHFCSQLRWHYEVWMSWPLGPVSLNHVDSALGQF